MAHVDLGARHVRANPDVASLILYERGQTQNQRRTNPDRPTRDAVLVLAPGHIMGACGQDVVVVVSCCGHFRQGARQGGTIPGIGRLHSICDCLLQS